MKNSKRILLGCIVLCVFMFACGGDAEKKVSKDLTEDVIDLAIAHKDGKSIELPYLYDSLAKQIPEDSAEVLVLGERLKARGFKVIDWGRGNYPPRGPRIVSLTLQKGDRVCEVSKIYYSTTEDGTFEMAERISCTDSLSYAKK